MISIEKQLNLMLVPIYICQGSVRWLCADLFALFFHTDSDYFCIFRAITALTFIYNFALKCITFCSLFHKLKVFKKKSVLLFIYRILIFLILAV